MSALLQSSSFHAMIMFMEDRLDFVVFDFAFFGLCFVVSCADACV